MSRALVLVFGLLVIVPASLVIATSVAQMYNLDVGNGILAALNKDATLTGRTILWEYADNWIERSPIFGNGYRSFWTGTSNDTVTLLAQFGLTDGRGFQFHHTFREILVDTGWVGLLAFGCTAAIFLFYVLAYALVTPNASSAFIASMYLLFLARTPTESIIIIFTPHTALFYACGTAAMVFFMNRSQRKSLDAIALQPAD
jgi:exopolysaccharide production protein ExoQ